MGESSHHSSHNHTWKVVNDGAPFRCNLCGATGSGSRYQCKPCNFNLHPYCVTCPPTLTSSTNPQHEFKLVNAKTMPCMTYRCQKCSHEIQGIFYHLGHSNCDYHPLCATSITVQPQSTQTTPLDTQSRSITVQPQSTPTTPLDTQSRSFYCHHQPYPQVYAPFAVPYYAQNYAPTSTTYIANHHHHYYYPYAPNGATCVVNPSYNYPNHTQHMQGMCGVLPYGQVPHMNNVGNYNQGQGNNFFLEEDEEDQEQQGSSSKISNFVQGFLGGVKILLTVALPVVALFI